MPDGEDQKPKKSLDEILSKKKEEAQTPEPKAESRKSEDLDPKNLLEEVKRLEQKVEDLKQQLSEKENARKKLETAVRRLNKQSRLGNR